MTFLNAEASHAHSLETLNHLYEHDDFMSSIGTLVDLGCGSGQDLEWWATRTTREDNPQPLNIRCVGVDRHDRLPVAEKLHNITYQCADFETDTIYPPRGQAFDVLWCHDSFQYAVNPLATLAHWWHTAADGGMLIMAVPQTTLHRQRQQHFELTSGCYYHHTMVSLIHQLAVTGWDCASGFFLKRVNEHWIHAAVYKSGHKPMNPQTTTWYELVERDLLPESAVDSVNRYGHLRQQDLIVPWLDKSFTWMGHQ